MIVRSLKTSLALVFALAVLLVVFFVAASAQGFQEHSLFLLARSVVFLSLMYMVLGLCTVAAQLIAGFREGNLHIFPIALEIIGALILLLPLIFAQAMIAFVR